MHLGIPESVQAIVALDDAAAAAALLPGLEDAGFATRVATTGDAVLAEVHAQAADVVVLDARLAGPDAAIVSRIKRDPVAYDTAIVFVAPRDVSAATLQAALRRGAFDVLLAPFAPAEAVVRVGAASQVKALRDELLGQARRLEASLFEDPLTGLYNRRFVMTQLGTLISGARRHGRPLSVAMIDVDRFKSFNDAYGHAVGDRVLETVAGALQHRMRAEDYLGRLGGEEFLALLPDTDEEAAGVMAERLRATVDAVRVPSDAGLLRVTVSIGWACWDADEDVDSLVRRADEALYGAKDAGRDQVRGAATLRRRS